MAGILRIICGVCGNVNDKPHNRDDWPPLKVFNRWFADAPVLCSDCAIKRRVYQKREEEVEQRKETNKPKKLGYCNKCYKDFKKGDKPLTSNTREWKFCSKICVVNFFVEHNERVEKALDKKIKALEDETESAIKELNKLLSGDIKRKPLLADMDALKDISVHDWENADWLDKEQKNICRQYVKNRQDIEDKKKEITKLEQDKKNNNKDFEIENSSKDEANCAKCSSSKVEFENTDENDGKKFCSKDCCVNYYMEKYYSTDNNQKKCDKCNLSFDEYYTVGGKGRYCDDCAKKTIESYRKERKNPRPTVKSVAEGKRLIDEGKEINISGSPLTEAEKNELMDYDFRKRIALESESTRDDFPFKNALVVAGAIGIVVALTIFFIKISRKKTKKRY